MKIFDMFKNKKIITVGAFSMLVLTACFYFIFTNNTRDESSNPDVNLDTTNKERIDLTFVDSVENMAPPEFPDNVCNVSDYGAVKIDSDGENNNTDSFKKAIEDCSNKGGGTVKVPAGEWLLNGPIHLRSNINLFLDEGSTITFSSNPTDYLPVVKTRYEGTELMNFSPMVYMPNCINVAITGKGTIQKVEDPNGWSEFNDRKKGAEKRLYDMAMEDVRLEDRVFGKDNDYLRPSFIQPYDSKNVLIEGITIKSGPMWTVHPVYAENLIIRNLNIEVDGSNTDGMAIDSSENVLIENNTITSGDDAIVIKSGRDKDAWRVNKPSQNIVIRKNIVKEGHGAVTIGSEMSGDVRNLLVEDLTVKRSDNGLRIKTKVGRGGTIENLLFKDILIKNSNAEAIKINFHYGGGKPKTTKEPEMKNVEFRDVKVINNGKKTVIRFAGLENRVKNVLFKNITAEGDEIFVRLKDADSVNFENVDIPFFDVSNSSNVNITNDNCVELTQENSEVNMECGN